MSTKKVFYSYAHTDEKLRDELQKCLALLKRENRISNWYDRLIDGGRDWDEEIKNNLISADVILLLISNDFIASDYIWSVELQIAMERYERAEARIIPIILRPCDWHSAPFGKLQALPKDGKPVITWTVQDEAWLDIAKGLRKIT